MRILIFFAYAAGVYEFYRLDIANFLCTVSHVGISAKLCELLPL
jgi:hypothetical protein